MEATLVHLKPEQKIRLSRRARRHKKSFAQEIRDAVELYLKMPEGSAEEMEVLASQARAATDRMLKKMNETIIRVDRSLNKLEKKP